MAENKSANEQLQTPPGTSNTHTSGSAGQSAASHPQDSAVSQQARKKANLEERIAKLGQQIKATQLKQAEIEDQLKTSDPQAVVKAHIKLLHDYNEIRDVGQGLMGIIAEQRGVRVVDVYKDFGVAEGD